MVNWRACESVERHVAYVCAGDASSVPEHDVTNAHRQADHDDLTVAGAQEI